MNSDTTSHSGYKLCQNKIFSGIYICTGEIDVSTLDQAFCTRGNYELESSKAVSIVDLVCCWS